MSKAKTLLEMAGATIRPAAFDESCLLLIDCQREYLDGGIVLPGIEAALAEIARLLETARETGAPIIHIKHLGRPGGAFDPARGGCIIAAAAPEGNETVIAKTLPNAFAGTELAKTIAATGRKQLLVGGFMTHMCISATVRAAVDHGLFSTVVASATATRDLPGPNGDGIVTAADLQRASLAALADRFCAIAATASDVPA